MNKVSNYFEHFSDRSFLKSRLARRLIISTIVFSSAITLLITTVQLYSEYKREVSHVHTNFTQVETTHSSALAASVWSFDDEQIQNILNGIANSPDTERAEIIVNKQLKWSAGFVRSTKNVAHTIPLITSYRGKQQAIGELRIVAGLDHVLDRLWEQAIFILLAIAMKTFLVAGFMLMLVYYLITRHLGTIVSHVSSHDIEATQDTLTLDRRSRNKPDELDDLIYSINEMSSKLESSYGKLKENEAQLAKAQEIAHLGSWTLDVNSKQVSLSDEMYQIYGMPPDELDKDVMGITESMVHPDDKARIKKQTQEAFEGNKLMISDYRIVLPSGELKYLHAEHESILDENGNQEKRIGVTQDVTQLKQAQIALEKHRDHLEEIVEARTRELSKAHAEMRQKERLATLGKLTATVSHELRNPLGAMRPSLYILQKLTDGTNEKASAAIERIDRNIKRCDNIIDDLLDFTRTGPGANASTKLDIWLRALIEEQEFPEGLDVKTNLQLTDLSIDISSDRLRRAVINIVENASQAMQSDEGNEIQPNSRLDIMSRLRGDRIEIVVSDNGPGISDLVLSRIYEPLFSTKAFGIGLGMGTVQHIMQQHEGGVEIDTEVDSGTTVTLWLPLSSDDNKPA